MYPTMSPPKGIWAAAKLNWRVCVRRGGCGGTRSPRLLGHKTSKLLGHKTSKNLVAHHIPPIIPCMYV